jgi:ABC-type multidrug transport system fused ATPase/permease subunit
MLILLAIILSVQYEKTTQVLPIIGVIALAAQRLLPMMQITYQSYVTLKGSLVSLNEIIGIIETPIMPEKNKENKIKFKNDIVIENLKYKYEGSSNLIIDKFNITIKKGEKIGIKGTTGSVKSTLQDIILGLLTPTEGQLKIDGIKICDHNVKNWQELISHVPQNTFLIDSTIEDNIAFNSNDAVINKIRIKKVAEIAQISEDIEKMPNKYETIVGERGIYLSGGQCQRIGIARALYKNSEILILDEATSALDIHTEKKVMKAIYKLHEKMTIVIIAHRLSTLEECDKIIEIK